MVKSDNKGIHTRFKGPAIRFFFCQDYTIDEVIEIADEMDDYYQSRGKEFAPYNSRCSVSIGDRVLKTFTHPWDDVKPGHKGYVVGAIYDCNGREIVFVWWEGTDRKEFNPIYRELIEVL